MKRGERDSRLRWAFGLAVLLHAGALAVVAHLPLAQASSSAFNQLTVFGADAPFSGSLVTLVDLPSARPPSSGAVAGVTPPPGPARGEQPEVHVPPPALPRPERSPDREPRRPETPARSAAPHSASPPAVAAGPADPNEEGGQPAGVGAAHLGGTAPGPERPGGAGEGSPAPVAGDGDGRGPAETSATGDGSDGGGGEGGAGKAGASGGQSGSPEGSPEAASASPAKVEWANPKVLRTVQPVYPQSAAANGVEGTVVMKVLVGERGQVVEAAVLQSSHDARLDRAALTAVRQWRYEPATQDGKAHPVYTRATVRFKLK